WAAGQEPLDTLPVDDARPICTGEGPLQCSFVGVGSKVQEGPRGCRDGNSVEPCDFICRERSDAVDAHAAPGRAAAALHADVHGGAVPLRGGELPGGGRAVVAEHCRFAARQHRRHLPLARPRHRADAVDRAIQALEAAGLQAILDLVVGHAGPHELLAGHDAVLARGELADRGVNVDGVRAAGAVAADVAAFATAVAAAALPSAAGVAAVAPAVAAGLARHRRQLRNRVAEVA